MSVAFDWEAQGSKPAVKTLREWEYIQFPAMTKPTWDAQDDGTLELQFQVRYQTQ